jgi:ATP-dependent DNA helicase RecQ
MPATPAKHKRAVQVRSVPWRELYAEARKRFGVKHFRPGQREVLQAVFEGKDVLGIMPTGAGKSLCYQLPALFLPAPVVVVSPLLALMSDQHEKAESARIAVERVDSTLTRAESEQAMQSIESGNSQLIYVTPERLENADFLNSLASLGVGLLAIDEAHCISQWGHDFRPAYLNLRHVRERLGKPPVVALTATATEAVTKDILETLGIPGATVINTGSERANLSFSVEMTVNTDAKRDRLLSLLAEETGSGIVYTASVKSANALEEWLTGNGVSAGKYHARMTKRERAEAQEKFMRGEYKVLFATKAFGLGIDKPDTRFVYHYEFPDSLESYYQEAGRGGRDGLPARAVLLYRLEDRRIQRFFMLSRYPRLEECERVLEAMEPPAGLAQLAERSALPKRRVQVILHLLRESGFARRMRQGFARRSRPVTAEELAEAHRTFEDLGAHDRERLDEMMHYAESGRCRKQLLREYFGEEEGEPCGTCDNCLRPAIPPEEPASIGSQPVTEIRTAVGPVVTTAPETLPQPEREPFHPGERIRHAKFGNGVVLDVSGPDLLVRFETGKTRKIRATYVRPVQKSHST